MQRSTWVLCAALVFLAMLRPAAGEVFLLRSGGRIEGELVNADENPRTSYIISLPSGGQLTLDAAVVDKVQPCRPELAEYEKVRRQYPDTVQGQLKMSDWCRDHNLPAQRKTHLERILQLDPDQAEARRLLGYHKYKDKWMTLEEEMAEKGYVKARRHDGSPSRTRNFTIATISNTRPRVEWIRKISKWQKWLDGNQAEQGRQEAPRDHRPHGHRRPGR